MIPIIAKILGSGPVIEQGLKLIDDMVTTSEEEVAAKANAKAQLLQNYAPYKLAQRYLALMFTFTFLGCFMLTLGMALWGQGDMTMVKELVNDWYIGEIQLSIILFYFGGGFLESVPKRGQQPTTKK